MEILPRKSHGQRRMKTRINESAGRLKEYSVVGPFFCLGPTQNWTFPHPQFKALSIISILLSLNQCFYYWNLQFFSALNDFYYKIIEFPLFLRRSIFILLFFSFERNTGKRILTRDFRTESQRFSRSQNPGRRRNSQKALNFFFLPPQEGRMKESEKCSA